MDARLGTSPIETFAWSLHLSNTPLGRHPCHYYVTSNPTMNTISLVNVTYAIEARQARFHHPFAVILTHDFSSGSSGHSPSRCKDVSRFSGVEVSASYFGPLPPRASSDEHVSPQFSATSLSRGSSPSSPCHLSAGTSSPSPGSTNRSPLQTSLPIPTPTLLSIDVSNSLATTPGVHFNMRQAARFELPGLSHFISHYSTTRSSSRHPPSTID